MRCQPPTRAESRLLAPAAPLPHTRTTDRIGDDDDDDVDDDDAVTFCLQDVRPFLLLAAAVRWVHPGRETRSNRDAFRLKDNAHPRRTDKQSVRLPRISVRKANLFYTDYRPSPVNF